MRRSPLAGREMVEPARAHVRGSRQEPALAVGPEGLFMLLSGSWFQERSSQGADAPARGRRSAAGPAELFSVGSKSATPASPVFEKI